MHAMVTYIVLDLMHAEWIYLKQTQISLYVLHPFHLAVSHGLLKKIDC